MRRNTCWMLQCIEKLYKLQQRIRKDAIEKLKQYLIFTNSLISTRIKIWTPKTWATMQDKPRAKLKYMPLTFYLNSFFMCSMILRTHAQVFLCYCRKRLATWWTRLAVLLNLLKTPCNRFFYIDFVNFCPNQIE